MGEMSEFDKVLRLAEIGFQKYKQYNSNPMANIFLGNYERNMEFAIQEINKMEDGSVEYRTSLLKYNALVKKFENFKNAKTGI